MRGDLALTHYFIHLAGPLRCLRQQCFMGSVRSMRSVRALAHAAALLAVGLGHAHGAADSPEAASGYTAKAGVNAQSYAVAAANPLATQAGANILRAGGSAVDAAIAVQMVLGLVEPQSSGIAGGAFMLHFNGKQVQAYDGRETAPMAADDKLFLAASGKPLGFYDAVVGGRSVGTPGLLRMLEIAHNQHGRLPWSVLFQPAIALAEQGFKVSPRLHTLLKSETYLKQDPVAAAYFYDDQGAAWPVGHLLQNPALGETLRRIATDGADAFYTGDIAQAVVDKVRQHPTNPGRLSRTDLDSYRALEREPLCFDYSAQRAASAQQYRICGMPPPSSGAIAIGQILGILQNTNAAELPLAQGLAPIGGPAPSADWLHLYTEAARLAFADRGQYVADPAFVRPPAGQWTSLLEPSYLQERAQRIDPSPQGLSMQTATAGVPRNASTSYAPMPEQIEYGTSHISIVDRYGNALAMTTTIEDAFGARQMVQGFLLNNQLSDFSFAPSDASGLPIANRVQPGKRPRSSMSPTLVFDKKTNQLRMSLGSPGGAVIIHYTAKVLYGMLHWGLSPQEAISLPNFASMNGPSLLEENRFPPFTLQALRQRGAEVREQALTSGLQALQIQADGIQGGADPRREGIVLGD